jgi:1-deoxy-D-xylulose-5-phosphate reductoisomerase
MPAVMNAANEIAVSEFLEGRIGFTRIAESIERTMAVHSGHNLHTIEEVLKTDLWARETALEICKEMGQ